MGREPTRGGLALVSGPSVVDTVSMVSRSKAAANRANALLSTGPKTVAGKTTASRNAMKHGLLSRQVVLPDESEAEFDGFRDRLVDDLAPSGELESVLAERIVLAAWRLRRVVRLEAAVVRSQQNEMAAFPDVVSMMRPPGESEPSPEQTVHTAMVRDAHGTGQLERLRRYEVTFERSLFSSIRELERLKKRRGGERPGTATVIDASAIKSKD